MLVHLELLMSAVMYMVQAICKISFAKLKLKMFPCTLSFMESTVLFL